MQLDPRLKKLPRRLFDALMTTWVLGTIICCAIFLYLYLSTSSRRLPNLYPMGLGNGKGGSQYEYQSKSDVHVKGELPGVSVR